MGLCFIGSVPRGGQFGETRWSSTWKVNGEQWGRELCHSRVLMQDDFAGASLGFWSGILEVLLGTSLVFGGGSLGSSRGIFGGLVRDP